MIDQQEVERALIEMERCGLVECSGCGLSIRDRAVLAELFEWSTFEAIWNHIPRWARHGVSESLVALERGGYIDKRDRSPLEWRRADLAADADGAR